MGEISSEALLLTRESENACWCGRRHDMEQGQVGKGYLVGGYGPERRAHIVKLTEFTKTMTCQKDHPRLD